MRSRLGRIARAGSLSLATSLGAALLLAGLAATLPVGALASAHPFHITVVELEYNPETRRAEIALQVDPRDLEHALTLDFGRRVSVDRDRDVDRLILGYLTEHFRLRRWRNHDPPAPLARLTFVGKEVELRSVWIYFEAHLDGDLHDHELAIDLFRELNPDQIHTVRLRQGVHQQGFTLNAEDPTHRIRLPAEARIVTEPRPLPPSLGFADTDDLRLETSYHWVEQFLESAVRTRRPVDRPETLSILAELAARLGYPDATRVYVNQCRLDLGTELTLVQEARLLEIAAQVASPPSAGTAAERRAFILRWLEH